MIELLPILLGIVSGVTLRRLALTNARLLLLTLGLALLCSFVAGELAQSWFFVLVDWITIYASHAVVHIVRTRLSPWWQSRKRRSFWNEL